MLAKRILITIWLCLLAAVALPAQEGAPGAGGAKPTEAASHQGDGSAEHAPAKRTLEMSNSEIFQIQFTHSVPYAIYNYTTDADGKKVGGLLTVYNVQPWQWTCLVLMLLVFFPVVGSFKKQTVGKFTRIMRGFCLWVRDEMVYSVMGKEEGRAFVPLFFFMFFFIVFQNVIGLIPSTGHSYPMAIYTPTGTPFVTLPLAMVTLALMLGLGIKKNGVFGFFKGLIPHGVPAYLLPIIVPIELAGLIIKPVALTIRLFANMLSGHLVIAAAIGLVFLFTKMMDGSSLSYLTALPCVGLAIFIYIIEAFVTLLQAYIFTFLSINFIHQSMHQEH
ncbi:MAG: F-type H+-transporting ATPase subunit a [Planctomycetota bacterium]|jgi:F-type H+-transporting ATPase subunit a